MKLTHDKAYYWTSMSYIFFGLVGALDPCMARKSSSICSCESDVERFGGFSFFSVFLVVGFSWDSRFFSDILFPVCLLLKNFLIHLFLWFHRLGAATTVFSSTVPSISSSSSTVSSVFFFFFFLCFFPSSDSISLRFRSLGFQDSVIWRSLVLFLIRLFLVFQLRRDIWLQGFSSSSFSYDPLLHLPLFLPFLPLIFSEGSFACR